MMGRCQNAVGFLTVSWSNSKKVVGLLKKLVVPVWQLVVQVW
jgi:hypothetical protein